MNNATTTNVIAALRGLVAATDGDIYTDAHECAEAVEAVFAARGVASDALKHWDREAEQIAEKALDETAGRIVGEDVRYCVSSLVAGLFKMPDALKTLDIDETDLFRLASREATADDYRDNAPERVTVLYCDEESGWEWMGPNSDSVYTDDAGEYFATELEAWQSAYQANGWDEPEGSEAFEHWAVSEWLAEKLEEKGEAVARDVAGLTIWARCTTGQMIRMDSVIRAIARDLLAA